MATRLEDSYARYPRPILWLVRGGQLHDVPVQPFYLSKRPVTNRQFAAFAPDHEPSPLGPGDDDPATGVGFEAAAGYCAWYARVSRKPMRLPTETEWEYACAGSFGLLDMDGMTEWAVAADGTGVLRGTAGTGTGFRVARSLK